MAMAMAQNMKKIIVVKLDVVANLCCEPHSIVATMVATMRDITNLVFGNLTIWSQPQQFVVATTNLLCSHYVQHLVMWSRPCDVGNPAIFHLCAGFSPFPKVYKRMTFILIRV